VGRQPRGDPDERVAAARCVDAPHAEGVAQASPLHVRQRSCTGFLVREQVDEVWIGEEAEGENVGGLIQPRKLDHTEVGARLYFLCRHHFSPFSSPSTATASGAVGRAHRA
jgi:hypothetical protein